MSSPPPQTHTFLKRRFHADFKKYTHTPPPPGDDMFGIFGAACCQGLSSVPKGGQGLPLSPSPGTMLRSCLHSQPYGSPHGPPAERVGPLTPLASWVRCAQRWEDEWQVWHSSNSPGGRGLRRGTISRGNFVFQEGGEIFPWRNSGVLAVAFLKMAHEA